MTPDEIRISIAQRNLSDAEALELQAAIKALAELFLEIEGSKLTAAAGSADARDNLDPELPVLSNDDNMAP